MKKILLSLFVLAASHVYSQTTAEKLEKAVKIYNAMRDFEDSLRPGLVIQADIDRMKKDIAEATLLLDDVKNSGSAEEQKVQRYFRLNLQYELGFIYGMMGRNREAYDVLKPIEPDYEYFSSDKFPMSYKYDGKNYSIKYENFAPTVSEYYTGMSEICANLSKDDESLIWARKSLNSSSTTDWYRYISVNKILEVKKKQNTWDKEVLDLALMQLNILSRLDTSYQRSIKENNYPTHKTGYDRIQKTLEKNPSLASGEYHRGEAAPVLAKLKDDEKALAFYSAAISGGYADNKKQYLLDAAELAAKNSDKTTGVLALDRLMNKQPGYIGCSEWETIANLYNGFREGLKSGEAKSKARDCRKKEEDEERRRKKRERVADRALGLYAGIYPGPMLCRFGHYRDYGGVLGITLSEKMAVEFSYKKINRNHVLMEDMTFRGIETSDFGVKWDGYKAHVALKLGAGNSSSEGFYMGPLFGFVNREPEPIYSMFTNESTFLSGSDYYHASEKSYELMFNYGMLLIKNHFMADMFMGFGAAYYQFEVTDSYYDNDNLLYAHPLLESRKPNRVGVIMRAGFTIGLATHKKYWSY
ncbi:MAG: hypothetical protein FD123_3241 [Bacteroidetes bacterium]|nr:MAG: hypothetical protein FD123_3241 [Bacteroidota bacterium]